MNSKYDCLFHGDYGFYSFDDCMIYGNNYFPTTTVNIKTIQTSTKPTDIIITTTTTPITTTTSLITTTSTTTTTSTSIFQGYLCDFFPDYGFYSFEDCAMFNGNYNKNLMFTRIKFSF